MPEAGRDKRLLTADMTVTGKVWFAPSARNKVVYAFFDSQNLPFPLGKANAIQINLHEVGAPSIPTIAIRSGVDKAFPTPTSPCTRSTPGT